MTPQRARVAAARARDGVQEGYEKTHGWIFEVPGSKKMPADAVPLKDMGRFSHEAVAVDPVTGWVYETGAIAPFPEFGLLRN